MSGETVSRETVNLHATLVAVRCDGLWRGVLLRGPSGAGKSDLALRAMAAGWRLVADDRVTVWTSGGALYGAAPSTLHGLLETRGVGVGCAAALPFARLALAVEAAAGAAVERMPEPERLALCGLLLPRLRLELREAGAAVKLARALQAASRGLL